MKKILSIDGGGIRGIIPAHLCEQLESDVGRPLGEVFDLIAGTSTGGIIALGLACKQSAKALRELYEERGGDIFVGPRGKLRYLQRPKYSNKSLVSILERNFGNQRLSDCQCEVLIPTYEISLRTPHYFTRSEAIDNQRLNFYVKEVALATSSAPTYFPPTVLAGRGYIDGGLVANNPTCLALAHAKRHWPKDDLLIVSIGTGELSNSIAFDDAERWGAISWVKPIIDTVFDGTASATETFLRQTIRNDRYWRFQCSLSEGTQDLDNASTKSINRLLSLAKSIVRERQRDLQHIVALLKQPQLSPLHIETRDLLAEINCSISESLSQGDAILCRGIRSMLDELKQEVANWKRGKISVPPEDSADFLIKRFEEAQNDVFSTRVKEFTGVFQRSSLPNQILAAHEKAKVPTTRVFVFADREQISGIDYREMLRQQKSGITVKIVFGEKYSNLQIEDFTIIDDVAIGVTKFSLGSVRAEWTINDPNAASYYREIRKALLNQSISFEKYAEDNPVLRKLWNNQELVDLNEANLTEYQSLTTKFFGEDIASEGMILSIQKKVRNGFYLLQRTSKKVPESVGVFAFLPVSRKGFRKLERDELKGSTFDISDVQSASDAFPIAFYLGAVAGSDPSSKAALQQTTKSTIRELERSGAESVFARPVTTDGLRLLEELGFTTLDDSENIQLGRICRLRLPSSRQ